MDVVGEIRMQKTSLVALIGILAFFSSGTALDNDYENVKEYCMTFESFSSANSDCSYWDSIAIDDLIGYNICFNFDSNYNALGGGHSTGMGASGYCDEDVDYSFVPRVNSKGPFPSINFRVGVGDQGKLDSLVYIPESAKNVSKGSINIQNLTYNYEIYEGQSGTNSDELGNSYYTYRTFGLLNVTINGPISLIVTTSDISAEDCIEMFKTIRITEIRGNTPAYWQKLGNRLFDNASYEDALAAYSNIEIPRYSDSKSTYEIRDKTGIALYKLGRYEDAINWFASLPIGSSDSSDAWYSYAMALNGTGRFQQAEYALDKGAERISSEVYNSIDPHSSSDSLKLNKADWNVPLLLRCLKSDRNEIQLWGAFALGEIKCRDAVGLLIECLYDTDGNVRYRAAEALGKIGTPDAIEPLRAILEKGDSNSDVLKAANRSLDMLTASIN